MTSKVIKLKISRPNDKGFTCYFDTKKELENFNEFIQTIIENAKKEGAKQK